MKNLNSKKKTKVLLLENIHKSTVKIFKDKGYQVKTFEKALSKEEVLKLCDLIAKC